MQQLHLYNTLTKKKEPFIPLQEGFAGIYVCGPTVYGDPHLGHAKSYVSFDVVVRYLRYLGYKVRYVQNITDVGHLTDDADEGEDKMARQSRIEQLEPMELAEKYTYRYFRDMDRLRVLRPDISPRATGHIPEQIAMIKKLIEKGHAYEVNGNVYFDVTSLPDYGKLSGRRSEEAEAGTRVEVSSDKRNSADFALWKRADENHIMRWDSPWGEGFPGWHIECSAMATRYLGRTIDIHGGGLENQFPHHECEIAQCEGAYGQPFVRYWLHNNMVTLNGKKMGKSLGNAITLEQFFTGDHSLLSRSWSPDVIRFFLLQSHYRSTTDFSEPALTSAESGYKSLIEILDLLCETARQQRQDADESLASATAADDFDINTLRDGLHACMNDDFNAAKAIAFLFEQLRPLKTSLRQGGIPSNVTGLSDFVNGFCQHVLGIWEPGDSAGSTGQHTLPFEEVMELLLELRTQARKNRDWAAADRIRNRLNDLGIAIEDGPQGSNYTIR